MSVYSSLSRCCAIQLFVANRRETKWNTWTVQLVIIVAYLLLCTRHLLQTHVVIYWGAFILNQKFFLHWHILVNKKTHYESKIAMFITFLLISGRSRPGSSGKSQSQTRTQKYTPIWTFLITLPTFAFTCASPESQNTLPNFLLERKVNRLFINFRIQMLLTRQPYLPSLYFARKTCRHCSCSLVTLRKGKNRNFTKEHWGGFSEGQLPLIVFLVPLLLMIVVYKTCFNQACFIAWIINQTYM